MSISLNDVSKAYGEVLAVDALNLHCPTGKMLALLGPSGCGKSSTLKMIAGIEEISAGSIHFGERNVSDLAPGARNIAMVFEDYALYPHLTVAQNIAFPLELAALPKKAVREKVDGMLALLSLQEIRDAKVRKLSGGAQQRVALGRALVRDPEVILFDEPCSALDPISTAKVEELIQELKEDYTIAIVTHNMQQAARVSDKTAFMYLGELVEFDDTNKIFTSPTDRRTQDYITGRFG